jgi:adenylate kinase family enzyme
MLIYHSFEFSEIPVHQSWVLDGFPMTLNQAQLLEEALTGYNRNFIEAERKKTQIPTLAIDPAVSKEISLPSSAFDFVILLDISDNSSLSRIGKLDIFLSFETSKKNHNFLFVL